MKKRWVAVIGTLSLVSGVLLGVFLTKKNAEIKYKELKERLAKFEDYFAIVNKWLKNRNQHISVADYFKNNHYEKIAIYGMGEIGKRLYEELCAEGIEVTAVFDRNAQRFDPSLNVYSIEGSVPEVDVVVITPTFDYDTIAEQLEKVVSCKIISISDVIMG